MTILRKRYGSNTKKTTLEDLSWDDYRLFTLRKASSPLILIEEQAFLYEVFSKYSGHAGHV